MKNDLAFIIDIAKKAGEVLLKHFGTKLTKKIKSGPNDFATEADQETEKLILKQLSKHYPSDAIVAEESGSRGSPQAEYTWIIDPLDGTYNFSTGGHEWGVMIARAKGNHLELAVMYNPTKDILATATVNQGSRLNNKLVNTAILKKDLPFYIHKNHTELLTKAGFSVLPIISSIDSTIGVLQGKAQGRIDNMGQRWDLAPTALLLQEFGLKTTDFLGNPYAWNGPRKELLAVLPIDHATLSKVLA